MRVTAEQRTPWRRTMSSTVRSSSTGSAAVGWLYVSLGSIIPPWQGEAKGQSRREQPIRRATAEPPPDPHINDRLEPGRLPEHAEEAGVVGGLPVDAFPVDLPHQPHGGPD